MSDFLEYFNITGPYFGTPHLPYLKVSLITKEDVLQMYKHVMSFKLEPIWLKAAEGKYVVVPYVHIIGFIY